MEKLTGAMEGCMRAPVRALCTVRDFYVKSITRCAGLVQHEAATLNGYGCPTLSQASHTFSSPGNGHEEDLRELIRAWSLTRAQSFDLGAKARAKGRESDAVIGRIDEDEACEFDEKEMKIGASLLTPRGRSSAAGQAWPGLRARKRKVRLFCMTG